MHSVDEVAGRRYTLTHTLIVMLFTLICVGARGMRKDRVRFLWRTGLWANQEEYEKQECLKSAEKRLKALLFIGYMPRDRFDGRYSPTFANALYRLM